MLENLKKSDVGDIAAYETWMREKKRVELVASFRELYGDKMPSDAVMQINRELGAIKSLFSDGNGDVSIDAESVQFLLWRSVIKSSPEVTLEQVGEQMTFDKLGDYIEQIMPATSKIEDEDPEKNDEASP